MKLVEISIEQIKTYGNWLFLINVLMVLGAIGSLIAQWNVVSGILTVASVIVLGIAIGYKIIMVDILWGIVWILGGIGIFALELFFIVGIATIYSAGIFLFFAPLLGILFIVVYGLFFIGGLILLLLTVFLTWGVVTINLAPQLKQISEKLPMKLERIKVSDYFQLKKIGPNQPIPIDERGRTR